MKREKHHWMRYRYGGYRQRDNIFTVLLAIAALECVQTLLLLLAR